MPQTPLVLGEKLYCLSYAPFRDGQTPTRPRRPDYAAADRRGHGATCPYQRLRPYLFGRLGQDQVAAIAKRHGLKVIQGIWLGVNPDKNRAEIETAIKIANEYPDMVRAVVVGNEVLLRGELAAERSCGRHP